VKSIIIAAIVAALVSATAATAASGLITGAQIKNGSIGLVDLSANAKRALKGQRGPAGPPGATGRRRPARRLRPREGQLRRGNLVPGRAWCCRIWESVLPRGREGALRRLGRYLG
jgi:hypothetical protein